MEDEKTIGNYFQADVDTIYYLYYINVLLFPYRLITRNFEEEEEYQKNKKNFLIEKGISVHMICHNDNNYQGVGNLD